MSTEERATFGPSDEAERKRAQLDRGSYRGYLRRRAGKQFGRHLFPSLSPSVLVAIIVALWLRGRHTAVTEYLDPAWITLLASGAVGLVAFGVHYLRAGADIFHEQSEETRRLERKLEEAREQTRLARQSVATSDSESVRRRAIVDSLQARVHFAVHELANKVVKSFHGDREAQWKEIFRQWEHETKAELERVGCTSQQISRFWDYTSADLQKVGDFSHLQPKVAKRMREVQFRIDRLREIVAQYSEPLR